MTFRFRVGTGPDSQKWLEMSLKKVIPLFYSIRFFVSFSNALTGEYNNITARLLLLFFLTTLN